MGPSELGYSGGIENFPRLLENWSSTFALTVLRHDGAIISQQTSKSDLVPRQPALHLAIREFNFDERFAASPPPGSFHLVTYDRLAWSLNSF
jgi:hypothetical protein